MPVLPQGRLWPVQHEAIRNLERSLAHGRPRALIQMATGSGKTFTAVSACYRLIKHANAKRILFLVDRNNLGRQTLNEFQQFRDTGSAYTFAEEFPVQHLRGNAIDPASKVVVTTIQRLYSILKGDPEYDPANEDESLFESARLPRSEPVPVSYIPDLPVETFDFIIIDECHRSIYNVWRQVIEYFDAFLIGLTATPSPRTIGFFHNNVVQDYSHTKAVTDGVNVGYDVYRIKTKISEEGGSVEAGQYVPKRDRRTRKTTLAELEDDLTYTANQLDRDVVAPDQIRLVARTFRDRLFTEIFPGRTEVPKTLVFAKYDSHADDIVNIVKEEFGKGNDFCRKITSKTTGVSPEDLLSSFRNSYNPRIAVTVDMIATGTDVKPLECILFLRNVNSAGYFEQMKGRGVRVIDRDDLQSVTPDAQDKTHFVIVDAVGVCERDKTVSPPLERKPSVSTRKLLQMAAMGMVHPDLVSSLASRLARLGRQVDGNQAAWIAQESTRRRRESRGADRAAAGEHRPAGNARGGGRKRALPAGRLPEIPRREQGRDRGAPHSVQSALPHGTPLRSRQGASRRAQESARGAAQAGGRALAALRGARAGAGEGEGRERAGGPGGDRQTRAPARGAARARGRPSGSELPRMARGEGAHRPDLHGRPTEVARRDQGPHRLQPADRAARLRGRAVQPVGRSGWRVPGLRGRSGRGSGRAE